MYSGAMIGLYNRATEFLQKPNWNVKPKAELRTVTSLINSAGQT
jgi:hypothetical protein